MASPRKTGRIFGKVFEAIERDLSPNVLPANRQGKKRKITAEELINAETHDVLRVQLRGGIEVTLAGSEESLISQLSLVSAIEQIVSRGSNLVEFEDWFKGWQEGWPSLINSRGTAASLKTNHPIRDRINSDETTTPGWRVDVGARPQYIEKFHPTQELNYRVIEYFPSRNSPLKSKMFSGSDAEIIQQIVSYEEKSVEAGEVGRSFVSYPKVKGQPIIKIHFEEKPEDVEPGFEPVRGRISFRIVTKSDHPESPLPKLTWSDLRTYAAKIWQEFGGPVPFHYRKGRESASYKDKLNGIESWQTVFSDSDAIELYQRLCAVAGVNFKLKYFNGGKNGAPSEAYPAIPKDIIVLGQTIKSKRHRPVATVWFDYASIKLPLLKGDINLVNAGGVQLNEGQSLDDGDID
ncbi:MAG: hypothetical protein F6K48_17650 [Okeania sp. SIO3H1]|uniref:hypothetical protein n=1 Tax=Okeania sp. SIO1I7 TaxID=2607772 RepID=UPI0013CD4504|nr:hypothetical protein [Okeania sp. SIO1I7]NEN90634.1 hypothetical protein [Okeania sp. SIO3H1]NET24986.1 hypothetical protein [Okeania sp. SIO1I7]